MQKRASGPFWTNANQSGNKQPMRLESDESLVALLSSVARIALVGASPKPDRPSHSVMRFLLEEGFEVVPVNPALAGQALLGLPVYASLAEIPGTIDMADIFRDSQFLPDISEALIALKIPAMWTQLGVTHLPAEEAALAAGINLVVDRCPAIEVPRLRELGLLPAQPLHR